MSEQDINELNKRVIYLENLVNELELTIKTIEKYSTNYYTLLVKEITLLETKFEMTRVRQ